DTHQEASSSKEDATDSFVSQGDSVRKQNAETGDGTDEANAYQQEAVKNATETEVDEGIIFTTLSALLPENDKKETTTNPEHPVDMPPNNDDAVPITTLPPPDLKAEPEVHNEISNQQNATQTDVEPSQHEEAQEPPATV
ncbi:hypothetical protein CRM22_002445, partial [Opisthorchis felineus]